MFTFDISDPGFTLQREDVSKVNKKLGIASHARKFKKQLLIKKNIM